MSAIGSIVDRFNARQQQAVQSFEECARAIAADNPPSDEAIAATLHESGKTLYDLRGRVEFLMKRRAWQDRVRTEKAVEHERRQQRALLDKATAELEAARQRYLFAISAPTARLAELDAETAAIGEARRELFKTRGDDLDRADQSLAAQHDALSAQLTELRERLPDLAGQADEAARHKDEGRERLFRGRLAQAEEARAKLEQQLADVAERRARVEFDSLWS